MRRKKYIFQFVEGKSGRFFFFIFFPVRVGIPYIKGSSFKNAVFQGIVESAGHLVGAKIFTSFFGKQLKTWASQGLGKALKSTAFQQSVGQTLKALSQAAASEYGVNFTEALIQMSAENMAKLKNADELSPSEAFNAIFNMRNFEESHRGGVHGAQTAIALGGILGAPALPNQIRSAIRGAPRDLKIAKNALNPKSFNEVANPVL